MNLKDLPLTKWTSGQLKMEVASLLDLPEYIVMFDAEMERKGYPSNDDERRDFIASRWPATPA